MRLPYALLGAILGAAAAPPPPSAASFYVPALPGLHGAPAALQLWAGHLPADTAGAPEGPHLYFVLTKARRTADKERVIFWFNGGPGCSSFDGLMMEVGPWRVDGHGGLRFAEGGWEEYAHVVYVDQPAGTGYSYTSTDKYVHELTDAAGQLLEFLDRFYAVFPELRHADTYLAGESFAGQYIPYFADAVLNSTLGVPLRGVAIGNGWIDGRRQYPAYLEYALKHDLVKEGTPDYDHAKAATDECVRQLDANAAAHVLDPVNTARCEQVLPAVLAGRSRSVGGKEMCTNIYDVRLEDTAPACGMNWPVDLRDVGPYLGRRDVINALHAGAAPTAWTECRGRVHQELTDLRSPSAHLLLPRLLARIEVLLFAGDQDFICNYMGVEATIAALQWNGGTGLGTVATQTWAVNGSAAGTWVAARNLTYAKVFDASHMVGYDVPHVAHDMILRFMRVDFAALAGGTARIPSAVGDAHKPALVVAPEASAVPAPPPSKTPEQDKAMWEAYYNAGSAALVFVVVLAAIAAVWWCRRRRTARAARGGVALPRAADLDEEESIPLRRSVHADAAYSDGAGRKGKARAAQEEVMFEVGDSDEEK